MSNANSLGAKEPIEVNNFANYYYVSKKSKVIWNEIMLDGWLVAISSQLNAWISKANWNEDVSFQFNFKTKNISAHTTICQFTSVRSWILRLYYFKIAQTRETLHECFFPSKVYHNQEFHEKTISKYV